MGAGRRARRKPRIEATQSCTHLVVTSRACAESSLCCRTAIDRDQPAFGLLLRRYRLSMGLTQRTLAELARLSLRGLLDIERGTRRTPYADTVDRLVDALELISHVVSG